MSNIQNHGKKAEETSLKQIYNGVIIGLLLYVATLTSVRSAIFAKSKNGNYSIPFIQENCELLTLGILSRFQLPSALFTPIAALEMRISHGMKRFCLVCLNVSC